MNALHNLAYYGKMLKAVERDDKSKMVVGFGRTLPVWDRFSASFTKAEKLASIKRMIVCIYQEDYLGQPLQKTELAKGLVSSMPGKTDVPVDVLEVFKERFPESTSYVECWNFIYDLYKEAIDELIKKEK